jgi:hypothetical protein
MNAYLRAGLALVLVAVFCAPAVAAGKRYVMVVNHSDALIDVGFLQPPTSGVLSLYGTLHAKAQQKFTLDAGEAKFVVRSKACHGSTYAMLPTRENVTVGVVNDCKVIIQ